MDEAEFWMKTAESCHFFRGSLQAVIALTVCTLLILSLLIHDKAQRRKDDCGRSGGVQAVANAITCAGIGVDITPCSGNRTWTMSQFKLQVSMLQTGGN